MNYKTKYYTEEAEDYFANPQYEKEEEKMNKKYDMPEHMPVGIYGNFVTQKGDPDIMEKSQCSIRERFGYCDEANHNLDQDQYKY